MNKLTFDEVRNRGLLLYEYTRGSVCYGLNIPKKDERGHDVSDIDTGGVYMCPQEYLLGLGFDYQEQIESEKHDDVWYEIGKYFKLLIKSNPVAIESLFIPEQHIRYEHPIMKKLKEYRYKFLSKDCLNSMIGFGLSQIEKCRGQNKLIVSPITKRLGVLDFVYLPYKQGSTKLKNWIEYRGLDQKYFGLCSLNNMKEYYGAYYDWANFFKYENISLDMLLDALHDETQYDTIALVRDMHDAREEGDEQKASELEAELKKAQFKNMVNFICEKYRICTDDIFEDYEIDTVFTNWYNSQKPIGYCGIVKENGDSNEVRHYEIKRDESEFVEHAQKDENSVTLCSIPKNAVPICFVFFNKDGYVQHCRKYREYQMWKKNRNEVRFRENLENGCEFDRKNVMHCFRIVHMGLELAKTGEFNVDRSKIDREFLLNIRLGNHSYDYLMSEANKLIAEVKEAIETSTLQEHVDTEFVNNLLIDIRQGKFKY